MTVLSHTHRNIYIYIYIYIYICIYEIFFTSKLDLDLTKKPLKCYILAIALFGTETWDTSEHCFYSKTNLLASREQYLFDKCLLLCVQSWTLDDGREDRPKHVVSFQNKIIWYISASSWFYYWNVLGCTALWTSYSVHWSEIPGKVWNFVLEKGREDQSIKTTGVGNEVLQRGKEERYIAHTTIRG